MRVDPVGEKCNAADGHENVVGQYRAVRAVHVGDDVAHVLVVDEIDSE